MTGQSGHGAGTLGIKRALLILIFSAVALSGCETIKSAKQVMPIRDYEKLLMGRIDADYIGNKNCLSACHYHDKIQRDFEASTMGAQMSKKSGMPLVNCESCHGPGSLAVSGVTPEMVEKDAAEGTQTACDYNTFIDLKNLPAQAQSLMCLKCHAENSSFNLHNWNAGAHAVSDVSCFNCHNIHAGESLITEPRDIRDMCLKCHQMQAAEFSLPSHHPVMEQKIFCTDCHNPHGTTNEGLLIEYSLQETCTRCHGEKRGPFVFEHADINDECSACHNSHGSVNNNLLKVSEPFLCLQCHGPRGHLPATEQASGAFFTRCTDCHSQIHGTDLPSTGGTDGRGKFIN
ncbi:MAG: DmsE family decaheme c-type cytochrome [Nitrospirae bacterium]|nr:DmsE family decaheme c-type cytochrome [Nitrospirota bacterium]